ncbi:beta-defensin 105-like [Rhinolophus ferrumequinum]|uniref:Beta-defensin n=1 Tax=Rhinolophus ferrumequinum TaxID=59479 RepID=A0A671FEA1_RHIFE|nr:beta-defensin 105-like [Rhinolophus ferrumequinum]
MVASRKMLYFVFFFFFILAQLPSGCQAGLQNSQPCQEGEFAACQPCRLGRGKCKRICAENEKVFGMCELNFFCCRRRLRRWII